ncbi:MAG: mannose-6-phosphate isomerase, class I [Spirochaetia bacterium]
MKKKKTVVTSLRKSLSYEPVELAFGTSGLRGLVKDITNLEAYVSVRGFLAWLLKVGDIEKRGTVFAAGDLRPSTSSIVPDEGFRGDILQAVCRAVTDAGLLLSNLGTIPTPALVLHAMRHSAPGIMVTGSHIPFDRNGLKFTRPAGEVLKSDEQPILAAVAEARRAEYERPSEQSIFDERGMLRPESRVAIPETVAEAGEEYVHRYASAFPRGALAGKRVLVWEHSAVGRELLARTLGELGAQVVTAGRSDTFVPVDTEAVNEPMLRSLQAMVDANGGASLTAVVSTDGDSDRPLVLAVDAGRVSFIPGDLLGILAARFLGVRHVAVPISCNDAVDEFCSAAGIQLVKTRIGSPHVIAALREAGWEGNGGFLTASPLTVRGGGTLSPLPTRDAFLPILCALASSLARDFLPKRFGRSLVLREFPMSSAREIMRWLTPSDSSIAEAAFTPSGLSVRNTDGTERMLESTDALVEEITGIRAGIDRYFVPADGFTEVERINWLDGVRVRFSSRDVAHLRPSGNAPEMRFYTNADTLERAEAIARLGVADDGVLRRMARDAADRMAIASYRGTPRPLPLFGVIQHYAWGGRELIPGLLGIVNTANQPCAELWMGAHPRGAAQVEIDGTRMTLDRLIAADPWLTLGHAVALRFAGRLPYLFKVLDVRDMASIQAHPSQAQAEEGFARETAAAIPIDAPNRTYRDENHKPEVHVVLTDFWMLHGFRPLEEMFEVFGSEKELSPILSGFPEKLSAAGRQPEARQALLRELYRQVMTMPQFEVDGILDPLVSRLEAEESAGQLGKGHPGFWALRAARTFPIPAGHRDRGILSIYLLNLVHLRPGQGTYQPAGTLHAYLEGADVELMASSDNVLRGGLTPKHVDVPELLATLAFREGPPPILEGRATSETSREFETPAEEFALERIEIAPGVPYSGGREHSADTLIVTEGAAAVVAAGRTLLLSRGGCAIVPAGVPYSLAARAASAVLYKAGVPAPD